MSLFESASLVVTPNGTKASKLYAIKPTSGAGDMTVVRNTTATRVNSSGLIESVASNVPRLDYTNSTCPSILVEPQRTNLLLRSQEIDNASWVRNATPTITANASISPDGTSNADNFLTTASASGVYQVPTVISGGTYTFSVYIKNISNATNIRIGCDLNPSTGFVDYNAVTNTIYSTGGAIISSSVENAGNGWYKIKASYNSTGTQNTFIIFSISSSTFNYSVWGAQLEAGSYATSYIPTTSASVTRNADVISKTGISSLIGQTEGTVFVYFNRTSTNEGGLQLGNSDGPNDYLNSIILQWNVNGVYTNISVGGATQFTNTSSAVTGRHKLAVVYKANDFALYIDGVQIATDTSGSIPSLAAIFLNHQNFALVGTNINSAALWKTRLSNTELAEITSL